MKNPRVNIKKQNIELYNLVIFLKRELDEKNHDIDYQTIVNDMYKHVVNILLQKDYNAENYKIKVSWRKTSIKYNFKMLIGALKRLIKCILIKLKIKKIKQW